MTTTDDDREFARALFADQEADQGPLKQRQPTGNHVPHEGGGNGQQRPTDYDDRNTVGALFGVHENNRNVHQGDHQ